MKYCLRNNAQNDDRCNKSKIVVQVNEAEQLLQYITLIDFKVKDFLILKNETYFSSLIHENIFLPINTCMESSMESR